MTRRTIGLAMLPLVLAGIGAVARPAADVRGTPSAVPAVTDLTDTRVSDLQQKGRYKKQGDNCVWDANDGGPNQCTPRIKGRFKKGDGDACTWDPNDVGDDQCRPPKGRWKKGGDNSCTWDANDGGPDQCNPRQAR